jgi:hypothetical protein
MNSFRQPSPTTDAAVHRVLAVADWSVDPEVVAEALSAHERRHAAIFGLLVPSRLSALDWIGGPNASRPCACEQLERLRLLSDLRGLEIGAALIGDPEPVPAVEDALGTWPAEELLLFEPERRARRSHPLTSVRRLERRTGLPVERIVVEPARSSGGRRRRAPRCMPRLARTA